MFQSYFNNVLPLDSTNSIWTLWLWALWWSSSSYKLSYKFNIPYFQGFVKWRNEKKLRRGIYLSHKIKCIHSPGSWILSTPTLKIIPILRWLVNSPLGLDIHWYSRSRIFEAISNGSALLVQTSHSYRYTLNIV